MIRKNYIREMRELVGKRCLLLVGAGVLLTDEQGRLLLQRRTDNGQWGIPGGAVEIGEATEDAARREFRAETGLIVEAMTLFGVFCGPDGLYTYHNGDQAFIVSVVYRAVKASGTLCADPDESAELHCFTPSELAALDLTPVNRPIIRQFLKQIT